MSLDFTAIPIRDPYKVAHPESVVLLADPNTIRLCVVVEVIVVVVVFVLSGYYTAITGSNETKITFEIIDGYDCSILAPRKDIEELVVSKSELIAFSSPRYTYDECIVALDTQGYDLCSDDHRQDYELSITGIDVGDDNCEEIFLTDGYRFCYNQEKITAVDAVEFNGIFAGSNEDNNYAWIMKDSAYFFSKGVGDFHQVTPTFDTQVANPMDSIFGSDFAPDDSSASLYVVATRFTEQFGLYKMSTDNSTSQLIASLQIPPTGAHGIAFGSKSAFVYYISELSHQGTIVKYNTTSKTISENAAVNCSQYITTGSSLGGGYGYRYLSYGSDGMLYAMCTTSTKAVRYSSPPASPPAYVFPVIQVDPHTLTTIKVIYAMINSIVDSNTGSGIDAVSQALQVGTGREMIFLGSSPSKTVIQGDLDDGLSSSGGKILTLQNIAQKGSYQGTYAVVPSNDVLYFAPKTYKTYIVSSGTFSTYPTNFLGQHYTATRVQFGFTYQICDGAYTNYTVDSSVSTSFYKQCQSSDGVYYQIAERFDAPSACQSYINSSSQAAAFFTCPAVQDLQTTFVTNTCGSSFEKVCDAVYTDNPPFSCETTVYPTWLTIIATAFANASGAWSLAFLAIKLILRKTHFHFVHEFEYDRKKERYMNRDYSKIHTKDDYIAGEGPTVDYNAPSGSALRARWKNELVTENSPHLTYASNNNNQYEMVHPDPSGGDGETVNPLDTLESGGLIGFDGSKLSKYA